MSYSNISITKYFVINITNGKIPNMNENTENSLQNNNNSNNVSDKESKNLQNNAIRTLLNSDKKFKKFINQTLLLMKMAFQHYQKLKIIRKAQKNSIQSVKKFHKIN